MTFQYLQGLNIFVITELTISTLFAWMLIMRIKFHDVGFFVFPAGSLVAIEKP
jgi:hypothetical protein